MEHEPRGRPPIAVTPQVVARYLDAVNGDDWPTVAGCYAADAELVPLGGVAARGNRTIAEHLRTTVGSLPDHHDRPTRVVDAGGVVIIWMSVTARTDAGRTLQFEAVDLIELSDDRTEIVRNEMWWDTAALRDARDDR